MIFHCNDETSLRQKSETLHLKILTKYGFSKSRFSRFLSQKHQKWPKSGKWPVLGIFEPKKPGFWSKIGKNVTVWVALILAIFVGLIIKERIWPKKGSKGGSGTEKGSILHGPNSHILKSPKTAFFRVFRVFRVFEVLVKMSLFCVFWLKNDKNE